MPGEVICEQQGAVAWVTLSHPGKLNAMSRAMWQSLRDIFLNLQPRTDLRAVVVQGADGHFCAGGDISEYPDFRFDEQQLNHFHEQEVWGALQAMIDCDVPVLALIEGNCMGAGLEIASCCDLRLATDRAKFGAPIARLGFPMAPQEARLVASQLGEHLAREMLLAASVLAAERLLQAGFLNQTVPAQELAAQAQSWLERLQALSAQAARLNKRTLRGMKTSLLPHRPYAYADSPEHREGVTAFLDKRPPVF